MSTKARPPLILGEGHKNEAGLRDIIGRLECRIDTYSRLVRWPALEESLTADLNRLKAKYRSEYGYSKFDSDRLLEQEREVHHTLTFLGTGSHAEHPQPEI